MLTLGYGVGWLVWLTGLILLVDLCTSVLWFGCYCISFVSLLRGLVGIRVGGGVSGWFVFGGLLVVDFVGVL